MDNQISAVMTATMSKIKEMVDTNTVVGEPITTPDDITLIPLSRALNFHSCVFFRNFILFF